jgi:hypothetical protein
MLEPFTIDRRSERGIALVTVLVLTLVAAALGTGLLLSSRAGSRGETSFKNQQRTFEVAVAGLERAREVLRRCRFVAIDTNAASTDPCFSISNRLVAAAGADGALVDVSSLAAFRGAGGLAADDVPLVADSVLDGVTYRVYLTNDPFDGLTNLADGANPDGRNVVSLTSVARGANDEGFTIAQGVYRTGTPFPSPTLPGLVTLPGPAIDYSAPSSNSITLNGNYGDPPCFATIATSTNAARDDARTEIPANRRDNYTTCNPAGAGTLDASTLPGSVENFVDTNLGSNPYAPLETNGPQLATPGDGALGGVVPGCQGDDRDFIRAACMNGWAASIEAQANGLAASGRGYVGPSPSNADLGTPSLPKVVVVTGDFTAGPGSFGGTLVVQGDLTTNGNFSYTGQILAIGNGWVRRNGGGTGDVCGGILVADVNDDGDDGWDQTANGNGTGPNTLAAGWVARPHYDHNGGGTSFQGKCAQALQGELVDWSLPMTRISFQQLR